MASNEGMYFVSQASTDTNCVTLAINNLFGEPIVTRDLLLEMKIRKKNSMTQLCTTRRSRGLICMNEIISHLLKLVQKGSITVAPDVKKFFRNSTAIIWYDLRNDKKLDADQFDVFFKRFHPYILAIYGNRSYSASVGHAVCIRRGLSGRYLWLLDSLQSKPLRVSERQLPVSKYGMQPFVVILKDEFPFRVQPEIINLTN